MEKYWQSKQKKTSKDLIKTYLDIQTKFHQISQTIKEKSKSLLTQQVTKQFQTSQNKISVSKVQWTKQMSSGLQKFIENNKDIVNQFTQNIILKCKEMINKQLIGLIQTFLKKFKIQQIPKYNKEQISQVQLDTNNFTQYFKPQSPPILKTIFKNIQLDYPRSYTQENIANVMNLYSKVHRENDKILVKKYYEQEKNLWFNQYKKDKIKYKNELKILQWFQNQRGVKYDDNNPNGATKKNQKIIPQLPICHFPKDLQRGPTIQRFSFHRIKTFTESQKRTYFLNQVQNYSALRLKFTKGNSNKAYETIWLASYTRDGRFVWRADSQVDKIDVKNLLQFILSTQWSEPNKTVNPINQIYQMNEISKKSYTYTSSCPSIVINAGSHGMSGGGNAYQRGNQDLSDERIINQTKQVIYDIIQQIKGRKLKLYLNEDNIVKKILISQMNQQRPGIYPQKANHIIDVQCYGAFSQVKWNYLTNFNAQIDQIQFDLKFLNQDPQYFQKSSIIKNRQDQFKLLHLFGFTKLESEYKNYVTKWKISDNKTIKLISSIKFLYKASQHDYSVWDYFKKFGPQTDVIIVIKTNRNKIIGAYTPLSFLDNQKQDHTKKPYMKDQSKKSFIFSLTENDKFQLKDQSKAILRSYSLDPTITFGNDQLKIVNQSHINGCRAKIYQNSAYKWSQKYKFKPNCVGEQFHKANRLFNGNKNNMFLTKQWQVWKILWG